MFRIANKSNSPTTLTVSSTFLSDVLLSSLVFISETLDRNYLEKGLIALVLTNMQLRYYSTYLSDLFCIIILVFYIKM